MYIKHLLENKFSAVSLKHSKRTEAAVKYLGIDTDSSSPMIAPAAISVTGRDGGRCRGEEGGGCLFCRKYFAASRIVAPT